MYKFKIDKTTYSKSQSGTMYDDSKNKPSLYPSDLGSLEIRKYQENP